MLGLCSFQTAQKGEGDELVERFPKPLWTDIPLKEEPEILKEISSLKNFCISGIFIKRGKETFRFFKSKGEIFWQSSEEKKSAAVKKLKFLLNSSTKNRLFE